MLLLLFAHENRPESRCARGRLRERPCGGRKVGEGGSGWKEANACGRILPEIRRREWSREGRAFKNVADWMVRGIAVRAARAGAGTNAVLVGAKRRTETWAELRKGGTVRTQKRLLFGLDRGGGFSTQDPIRRECRDGLFNGLRVCGFECTTVLIWREGITV